MATVSSAARATWLAIAPEASVANRHRRVKGMFHRLCQLGRDAQADQRCGDGGTQINIHRRGAETLRKTNSKSKPESAEVAEDAEEAAGAMWSSEQVTVSLPPSIIEGRIHYRCLSVMQACKNFQRK
jgi:hypothetical protein